MCNMFKRLMNNLEPDSVQDEIQTFLIEGLCHLTLAREWMLVLLLLLKLFFSKLFQIQNEKMFDVT